MKPREALQATGRRSSWVATQMGIDRTYLWRLLNGQRRWTATLGHRYAVALGLAESAIDFGYDVGTASTWCSPSATSPSAAATLSAAREGGCEGNDTAEGGASRTARPDASDEQAA